MGQTMRLHGVCVIEMDLEGHGYSGGERAYVEDYHHWVDDYRRVRFDGNIGKIVHFKFSPFR